MPIPFNIASLTLPSCISSDIVGSNLEAPISLAISAPGNICAPKANISCNCSLVNSGASISPTWPDSKVWIRFCLLGVCVANCVYNSTGFIVTYIHTSS